MIKFPYGISNYYRIVTENYFYVDRSNHIRLIEEAGDQLLFLRPRRFGKSLVLSMLENYYDVAKADDFDKLFGNLAIGKNPTPIHNKYLVMKWDFSNISPEGDSKQIEKTLSDYLNERFQDFANYYQSILKISISINPSNPIASFLSLLRAVRTTAYKLYLLIDEYDNFANEVMMGKQKISNSRYDALTSAESFLKTLFKSVKSATSGQGLERVFITGVSPVLMTDITSSYNVAKDIYLRSEFNDLCGFRESELASILHKIAKECDLTSTKAEQALTLMKDFYDGYCFNYRKTEDIYNPTLALYFLDNFQQECQFPRKMLDNNLAMDRGKLSYVSSLLNGESVIFQALNENPPLSLFELADRFGVQDMLSANKDTQFIVSLLYYLGILTLNGETEVGELRFKIPNLVARKLYVERLFEMHLTKSEREQTGKLAQQFFQTGDLQAICDFMEQHYFKVFDNRDYKLANELTIKTAFLTILFNDVLYVMDSEFSTGRRYVDLSMIIRPERRKYSIFDFILEFKYISLSEVNLSGEELKDMSIDKLNNLALVKKNTADAKKQLLSYNASLQNKYGDELKLKLISVVAVGFDRLVWEIVGE
ncbi:AAA family ATPase [Candidatus Marithrix sp. Canyon 246]|uniref:AAA family ATPase n=1 Tax=Candidatus Marithrix sp. Canyon 246 TaxID=1827136 RepID=UPI000B20DC70|nr:AAA family ATPase [Candidatus Marithrix sp. Canyon 246]